MKEKPLTLAELTATWKNKPARYAIISLVLLFGLFIVVQLFSIPLPVRIALVVILILVFSVSLWMIAIKRPEGKV